MAFVLGHYRCYLKEGLKRMIFHLIFYKMSRNGAYYDRRNKLAHTGIKFG